MDHLRTTSGSDPSKAIDLGPDYQAVLFADVVEFSRLMEIDSVDTYRRFRQLKVTVIDPLVVSCRGETVKNTGDGFVCVFDVASDALRCAQELHKRVKDAQPLGQTDHAIVWRVGLHWGRLIQDQNDIFGHVVNVASRLQELAPPGSTVVSRDFLDASDSKQNLEKTDLGPVRLKNLSEPIPAALLGGLDSLPQVPSAEIPEHATVPSIALLPFENLSASPETENIAMGFVDDIITSLSNLREVFTVSNGSTTGLAQTKSDMNEIVEKLGVQYLFSGRIHSYHPNWRLSVELTDTLSGEVVWADQYKISIDEIFDLQDEITLKIVRQISSHVQTRQVRKALRKPPQSLTAYDYFLRALSLIYQLKPVNFEQAETLLNNAIREDPTWGAPFALLAHWHMFRAAEGWSSDPEQDVALVLRNARLAIERDETNALAHALLGQAMGLFEHDLDAAKAYVDRARHISPNSAWAWTFSSGPYGFAGETETAIKFAERGLRLSPIDQHAFFMQGLLAQNHYLHGNYAESTAWARRSLAANPRFGNAARVLIASLVAQGQHDAASGIVSHHNVIAPKFRLVQYKNRCPFTKEHAEIYIDSLARAGVQ